MSESSSISSSRYGGTVELNRNKGIREFDSLERAAVKPVPVVAILLVFILLVAELFLHFHREWFADRAAWQWHAKTELVAQGELRGNVVVMGTSILFHSLDAQAVNALTQSDERVVNLALNGMKINAQAQFLERYLAAGSDRPQALVLEVHDMTVNQADWQRGPYFREWATCNEMAASGCFWYEPSLVVPLISNRLLTSYSYQKSIDNFIFSIPRERGLPTQTLYRNRSVTGEIRDRLGFSRGDFDKSLSDDFSPQPEMRPWNQTDAGKVWLNRLVSNCNAEHIDVLLLQPPVPIFVQRDRDQSGFANEFLDCVRCLRTEFPDLLIEVWNPGVYPLDHFADDHHLSPKGAARFTREFAEWVKPRLNQVN